MRAKRTNGQGSIEALGDRNGYVTLRGRVMWRGARYTAPGVGLGRELSARWRPEMRDALRTGAGLREFAAAFPEVARDELRLIHGAWRSAEASLEVRLGQLRRGERPKTEVERRPLSRQLALWLQAGSGRRLPHTQAEYERSVALRIEPHAIARAAMGDLAPEDVDAWLEALVAAGTSSYQRRYAYERLMECLKAFEADGNLYAGVRAILAGTRRRRPKHRKTATVPLDEAQVVALMAVLRDRAEPPFGAFYSLQFAAGLRFNEAAALPLGECHGVDQFAAWLANGEVGDPPRVTIGVRWQLDRDTRLPRHVKTEAGERTVPLHAFGAKRLVAHLAAERERRTLRPDSLVFVLHRAPHKGPHRGEAEAPIGYSNARRKLADYMDLAGLSASGKTHVLRHTFGTLAGELGVPTHVLQGLLGHSDPKTSLIYVTRSAPGLRRAADAMGEVLRAGG